VICFLLVVCLGLACHRTSSQRSEILITPSPQSSKEVAKEITDPTCCGLISVGNQGIDKAWHQFIADGRYRLALKKDLKSPAREFGSNSLNSIFAYCWGQLGYNSVKDHLAAIVVDTTRNDADRFGLVIFSAAGEGDGSYKPHWIYQVRDLSRSVVWTGSGDLMVADYNDDGSREVSYVNWDKISRRFIAIKSRPRPA
jgi:hypothetical protein